MKKLPSKLTIGALAKIAGVGVETIRFYERKGLIKQPPRSTGFREYPPESADRIRFIKRAQELGFTLREVSELLKLQVTGKASCASVKKRADQKISEIEQKIRDLKRMQNALSDISHCCARGTATLRECPILECFEQNCH